jgi:F0F1-type ATP synthase membrane subunit b/b'
MVAEHKPDQAHRTLKPEERFKELVAIREKETEVRSKLEAARTRAQERLASVGDEIDARRAEAMKRAQAEVQRMRSQGLAEAEAEARRLLERAEQEAKAIEDHVRRRQHALLDQLKEELLALK